MIPAVSGAVAKAAAAIGERLAVRPPSSARGRAPGRDFIWYLKNTWVHWVARTHASTRVDRPLCHQRKEKAVHHGLSLGKPPWRQRRLSCRLSNTRWPLPPLVATSRLLHIRSYRHAVAAARRRHIWCAFIGRLHHSHIRSHACPASLSVRHVLSAKCMRGHRYPSSRKCGVRHRRQCRH